ncbi:MAG: aminoacetone oxidase family FAD-binding enzyme [Clostridia bacterium]|nr:aminoacetone oxidase family FAD-binding enzyme [Clostridia bacterium]
MINDLIVIGGGAAGLCAAVYFKKNNPTSTVRILEALPRVGKKLSLTGNGRCNITNKEINLSRFHGENVEFAQYALEKYDRFFTEDFFGGIGVNFVFEGNKGYPASLQATSVVDCLRFATDELGIITHLETPVTNIQIYENGYKIISNKISFITKNLIIATGLLSGGERMGSDGKMLEILRKADFKVIKLTPAIVQIKTETDIVKQLKGIKLNANVTLGENTDFGEVLFTDYGLSGPPVLQVSRGAARVQAPQKITLDIMPQTNFNELLSILTARAENLKKRNLDEFFTGMLQKRVGQVLLKLIGCRLNENVATLNSQKLKSLVSLMKNWSFNVTGTTGFANSQVTAGGLDTNCFNPTTMESKSNKGLYCIGEILDIDGDCGGFNLQWAWSSAFCAGDHIGKTNDNN